jgi:hypothetical protein
LNADDVISCVAINLAVFAKGINGVIPRTARKKA